MKVESEKYPGYTLEENLKRALMEMLLLSLLSEKESYVGELVERMEEHSGKRLNVVFPYSALYRAEEAGFIRETRKRIAPDGRRRQYMAITPEGTAYLRILKDTYAQFTQGVAGILEAGNKAEKE